ncbi:hypothetical protein N7467_003135, partial [Penicillium canescens]
TINNRFHNVAIVRGIVDAVPAVLYLLDTGAAPFSKNLQRAERLREFVTTGLSLWLAIKNIHVILLTGLESYYYGWIAM